MTLADLLVHATMLSATPDETNLAPLRERIFGRLRALGWAPGGRTRGDLDTTEKSDGALLNALVNKGDTHAFKVLFDRHGGRLNGHARRWLPGADAADAVQEAFLVLFEKAPTLLAREGVKVDDVNVGGYLFVTLRYKILRALASREAPEAAASEEQASPDDDGITALLRRDDAAELASLLERTCNPLEQHVVMLDLEDRDDAEIASQLGISAGNVRVVRCRALKKLRSVPREKAS
jgi:RNA polymerase sigma-70 factor (ECF subfamily)